MSRTPASGRAAKGASPFTFTRELQVVITELRASICCEFSSMARRSTPKRLGSAPSCTAEARVASVRF